MTDKQVILISGDKTKWYEQAIFILRRGQTKASVPKDFLGEAEAIVCAYLHETADIKANAAHHPTVPSSPAYVHRKRTNFTLNMLMLLSCVTLAVTLGLHFFN